MISKNKGFSLLELFAVIIMTTAILFPMLNSLIGNYEVNIRMHDRKAASSLAMTSVEAFDKVDYNDLLALLDVNEMDGYAEITAETCASFDTFLAMNHYLSSSEICTLIFDQTWSNVSFDSNQFKVYIYPYYLTEIQKQALLDNQNLPSRVRDDIRVLPTSDRETTSLIRLSVWIRYADTELSTIVASGVVSRD